MNEKWKFRNFYDGLYIEPRYQNMHLNEEFFTGSERQTVVVFGEVGRLEVKGSVVFR